MKLIYPTLDQPWAPFLQKFGNAESFQTFQQSSNTDGQVVFYYNTHHKWDEQNTAYWQYLEENSNITMIYDLHGEPASRQSIREIVDSVKKYNVTLPQVIIIAIDNAQKIYIKKLLHEYRSRAIRVVVWNHWLTMLVLRASGHDLTRMVDSSNTTQRTKFSFLLRRYSAWRLLLPMALIERNVLWNNFSFTCLSLKTSYSDTLEPVPIETAVLEIQCLGQHVSVDSKEFLKKLPMHYNCEYSDITVGQHDEINLIKVIRASDFHLLIEKSYVHDWVDFTADVEHNEDDGHFISEKTYRALVARRPFIVYSKQNWLTRFRRQGFKTFSPFINESYDDEPNTAKRLAMVADEVERICKLSADEYATLVNECQAIVDHNYALMTTIYNKENLISIEQILTCKV